MIVVVVVVLSQGMRQMSGAILKSGLAHATNDLAILGQSTCELMMMMIIVIQH